MDHLGLPEEISSAPVSGLLGYRMIDILFASLALATHCMLARYLFGHSVSDSVHLSVRQTRKCVKTAEYLSSKWFSFTIRQSSYRAFWRNSDWMARCRTAHF